jgi:hypothetical protein
MSDHLDRNADKTTRELEQILNRVDQLPVLDDRSPDEIIGYDENGLPSSEASSIPPSASMEKAVIPQG